MRLTPSLPRSLSLLLSAVVVACTAACAIAATSHFPRASFLGVQATRGALVTGLVDGGSAKAAGLCADDVIVAVDDHAIADPGELVAQIAPHRAGDEVTIRWLRDGKPETAAVVMRARPFESSPGTRTEYGAVPVDGALRRTIVTAPDDDATHPGLLYITGIGCFSQESLGVQTTEAKLLHGLARAGFVTMRVEKSGVGDSQGAPCSSPKVDFDAETAGYVEGLKALRTMPRVDAGRVFVVGLSIGGVEAPIVAERVPVRGIVVVNTVAKPFVEYLLETRRRQNTLEGLPFDEIDRRQRLGEACNHALLVERERPDALLAARPECASFVEYPAPYTFMQQWAALDPSALWKRVGVPVLIVQGERDFVATVADAPLLRDIVESFHPGSATLAMVPTMDHYLTRVESMKAGMTRDGVATAEFDETLLKTIAAWLAVHAS